MGPPLGDAHLGDRRSADGAGLAGAPVNMVAMLVVAGDAVGTPVVGHVAATQSAAPFTDRRCQSSGGWRCGV